jgi:phage terminase small subunit
MPLRRPDGIGPAGVEAWEEAISTLRAVGEDPELSAGAIGRYARLVDDAEWVRKRWIRAKRPTKTMGSQGQTVIHPFLKAMQDAEEHAARAAERLGLTPSGRQAVKRGPGRPMGSSQAADRRPGLRKVG